MRVKRPSKSAVGGIEVAVVHAGDVRKLCVRLRELGGELERAQQAVHRRFTDLWTMLDGSWKLVIRQATITSVT